MAVPHIIKSFIKDNTKKGNGRVMMTIAGSRIELNPVANYIFSLIEEDKYTIEELIQIMIDKFPKIESERIEKDLMNTLEALWTKHLIVFSDGESPFAESYKVKVNESDYIKKAMQEECELINHPEPLKEIYLSPIYQRENIFNDSATMFLLHTKAMEGYVYYANGIPTDYIIVSHKGKMDIVSMAVRDSEELSHMNQLLKYIFAIYKKQPLFISATNEQAQDIYKQLGFTCVGTLKKEVTQGDINVLMML